MRRWPWVAVVVQAGLLAATWFLPVLGSALWHHLASLGVVLGATMAARRWLDSRAVLAIGVLITSVLAAVSGFLLLYLKEWIRPAGIQDQLVWWHVLWSWAAAVFFFQHTWINRVQFLHFFGQSLRRAGPGVVHVGAYILSLAFLVISWTVGKSWFTAGNYIASGYVTWLAFLVPAAIISLPRRDLAGGWKWRRMVDLGLVPAATLATLSGIPLVFFGDAVDAAGLKYASKYWHTAPSILFTILVWTHSVQVWRLVRGHWAKGHTARSPRTFDEPTKLVK